MTVKEIIIKKETGINAADAAVLVKACAKFNDEVYLSQGTRRVNAKSIMGVIALALKNGDCVTVEAVGKNEKSTLSEVISVINAL